MNPFLKNASGAPGQQLADRLIGRIEKARTEQPDPNEALLQAQEQQAEQTKEQQAMQEQQIKAQEREQKQTEMKERQDKMHTQQRSDALARAGNTPSFKPYSIKQAGRRPLDWATSLLSNIGTAAKHPASVGTGTGLGWDWLTYGRENGYAPNTWTNNRISGALLNSAIAGSARQMQRGWNQKARALTEGMDPAQAQKILQAADVKGKMLLTGGTTLFPMVERPLAAAAVTTPKILDEKQKQSVLDTQLKEKSLNAPAVEGGTDVTINQPEGSDVWKWLAGAGLGLAAIPAAAYAYKAFRKPDEEEEKRKRNQNPDRVALEIPSHKISDSLYSRLGREILFEDDKEAERRAKSAHVKMAETALTYDQAQQNLTPRALNKYVQDRHQPKGMWSTIENFAPTVSGLLGGPQLSTFNQRMAQHLVPLEQGQEAPWVQKRWADVMRPKPKVKWTPGQEFNLTPNYTT